MRFYPYMKANRATPRKAQRYSRRPMVERLEDRIVPSHHEVGSFLPVTGVVLRLPPTITGTALSSSVNSSVFGQSVTFTATITRPSLTFGTPTGTVQFLIDGSDAGSPVNVITSGRVTTANFSTAGLAVGTHTVTARYSGDGRFLGSSGTLSGGELVNKAGTSTKVATATNPTVFGQMMTFTALFSVMAPGAGTPSGTVQFLIDGSDAGSPVNVSTIAGVTSATFSTTTLTVGKHTVTARYSGDSNFAASAGSLTAGQVVNVATTTTTVSSSVNSSEFGQSVTFTATVSVTAPGAGTPTGTVQFQIDGSNVGVPVNVSSSGGVVTATFTTATLTVKTHTIRATYKGDRSFTTSTGTLSGGQVVTKDGTSTTVASSVLFSVFGQIVIFTASVSVNSPGSSPAAIPTGMVSFFDGSTNLGQGTLRTAGGMTTASFSTALLGAGMHTITAKYNGDSHFTGSTGTLSGGQVVSQTLLFQDTFTTDTNPQGGGWNDINHATDTARQGGRLAQAAYLEQVATAAGGGYDSMTEVNNPALPNTLLLAAQPAAIGSDGLIFYTWVTPDQDFAAPGLDPRHIHVTIDPLGPGSSGSAADHWAAVMFGAPPGSYVGWVGTGVLVRASGDYQLFDGGKQVSAGNVGGKAKPQQFYTIDFSILDPSTGRFTLAINGHQLFAGTHGPYTTDYITLEDLTVSSGSGTQFDYFGDLTVSTDHLFQDSFKTDSNPSGSGWNDINHADGSPRQGGVSAPLSYLEQASTAMGGAYDTLTQVNNPALPNSLLLATQPAAGQNVTWVAPNQDFGRPDLDLTHIHVAIDPLGPGSSPSTDHWAGVVFGTTAGSLLSANGTGLLIRDSGEYQIWDGGTLISSGNVGAKGKPQQFYTIDFSILDPSTGQFALAINNQQLFTGTHGRYTTDYVTLEDYTQSSDTGTQMDYFQDLRIDGRAQSLANTTYYVSPQGDDRNPGTSPTTAWRTIDRVNKAGFRPGDQILFQGGATFTGNLAFDFRDEGAPGHPITVGSFGNGRATIAAGDGSGIAVLDGQWLTITSLVVVGSGYSTNTGDGIRFMNDYGPYNPMLSGITVDHVEVSGFGHVGILTFGPFRVISVSYSSTHDNHEGGLAVDGIDAELYVGHVQAYHNAGSATSGSGYGIFIGGSSGVVVEHCETYDNGWLPGNGGQTGGIEAISTDHVLLQYNESYANKRGPTDGDGIVLDISPDSIMQFNYTHDNDGGGLWLGAETGHSTTNDIIRYNVSENDSHSLGGGGILIWQKVTKADIYGNTVFESPTPSGAPVAAILLLAWSGTSIHVRNNIFITTGGQPLVALDGGGTDLVFQGNVYWSSGSPFVIYWAGAFYRSLDGPNGWRAQTGEETLNNAPVGYQLDPQVINPGRGGTIGNADALATLISYQLRISSPLIHAGLDLSQFGLAWDPYGFASDAFLSPYFNPTPKDYYGDPLPAAGTALFSIGAYQAT